MSLTLTIKDVNFSVGDKIRVTEIIKEGEKERSKSFDGIVIAIKGKNDTKTFTLRRIGLQGVGIERIFPVNCPSISLIKLLKKASRGVKHSKLYYLRKQGKRAMDKIAIRSQRKRKTQANPNV